MQCFILNSSQCKKDLHLQENPTEGQQDDQQIGVALLLAEAERDGMGEEEAQGSS